MVPEQQLALFVLEEAVRGAAELLQNAEIRHRLRVANS